MPDTPGERHPTDPPEPADNVADLVRAAARSAPDHPAFVDARGRLTWSETDAAVDRAAAVLLTLGLPAGSRVLLALGNDRDFPIAYFGTLRAGLVALPSNAGHTAREFAHVLRDSGAAVALVGPVAAAAFAQAVEDLDGEVARPQLFLVGGSGGDGPSSGPVPAAHSWEQALDAVDPRTVSASTSRSGGEDLAVLLYTSGTSGAPRGAMLTHRALLADLDHVSRIEPSPTRPDDVVLLVLPLFHIFGLNTGLGMVAKAAATGILVERFDAGASAEAVRRHGVTSLIGAPPMYVAWSQLPDAAEVFATVRLAVSGAAPLPVDVLQRFRSRTGHVVHEGYGLTETAPSVSSTLCSWGSRGSLEPKPGSVGRPVPGVEVTLVDRSGSEVEPEDPGEIRVRGDNLFSGYWPDGREGPDADGWWCTGDIAVADEVGDLTLVDRNRELILVSGFNVYPREVEMVLEAHPGVAEAAVLAIPHPYTGSAVQALIVPRPGAELSVDSVLEHASRSLARFKCPTAVEFVDELPHTATGKVSKGRLRELSAGGVGAAGDGVPRRTELP